jgi:hypothetical protein
MYIEALDKLLEVTKQVGVGLVFEYSGIFTYAHSKITRTVGWVLAENIILIGLYYSYKHYLVIKRIGGIKAKHKGRIKWGRNLNEMMKGL